MKEFLVNSDFGFGWEFINLGGHINRRLGLVVVIVVVEVVVVVVVVVPEGGEDDDDEGQS